MTKLLQQAIAELQKLPIEQQDAVTEGAASRSASRLLAELKDERAWSSSFQSTTDEQWDRLAAMVRQDIAEGKTIPSDEVFPT